MNYDDDTIDDEIGFKIGGDDDEELIDPLDADFGLDEEDPDRDS